MDDKNKDRFYGTDNDDCCEQQIANYNCKNDCCGQQTTNHNCKNDCCGPQTTNNNCKNECCKPKGLECNYMDIRKAKCIPILSDRIYDCVDAKAERMRYIPLTFTIKDLPAMQEQYTIGSEICIRKIAVTYDFIGLVNDGDSGLPAELPVIVDILPDEQLFTPAACSPTYTCGGNILYNTYNYTFETSIDEDLEGLCHNKGIKSRIAINNAEFYVCNLRINVYGKIGCLDFEAYTEPYSGSLQDLGGVDDGIRPLDFIETMCFPTNGCPTMELKFRSKINVDCIRVNERYEDNTFTALTLVSLIVKLQAYSTIKEELVVYTTPYGFICDDCNNYYNDDCNNDCNCNN